MTENFFFEAVRHLLSEIECMIAISHDDMKRVEALGHNDPRVVNDPKLPKVTANSIEFVNYATQMSEKLFVGLKCDHIDSAAKSLGYWAKQGPHLVELNTRTRALRDAIKLELKQYLYYQYPKEKGNNFVHGRMIGHFLSPRSRKVNKMFSTPRIVTQPAIAPHRCSILCVSPSTAFGPWLRSEKSNCQKTSRLNGQLGRTSYVSWIRKLLP